MKDSNTLISIQISKVLYEDIKQLARENEMTMTAYIRLLLKQNVAATKGQLYGKTID